MADTMVFALVGSLVITLTLLPVLCAWFMRQGVREKRNKAFEWIKERYIKGLDYSLADPWRIVALPHRPIISLLIMPFVGAEFMPQTG